VWPLEGSISIHGKSWLDSSMPMPMPCMWAQKNIHCSHTLPPWGPAGPRHINPTSNKTNAPLPFFLSLSRSDPLVPLNNLLSLSTFSLNPYYVLSLPLLICLLQIEIVR
jgi:hypothetical protein